MSKLSTLDLESLRSAFMNDSELALAARFWTSTVLLRSETDSFVVTFDGGKVVDFGVREVSDPTITVTQTDAAWEKQLAAVPEPFWQDALMGVTSMHRQGTIDGDPMKDVYPYYKAIQRITSILREQANGGQPAVAPTIPKVDRKFDSLTGRYLYLDIDDVQYRVYYEEAGKGIPLVCQHTAGSDGRQYRHLLEDPDLQQDFRMIAYDLPYHGKSIPPTGKEWWKEEYKLTQDFLLKFVPAFSAALGLDLAPDLALYRPDAFRAVIGLTSGIYLGPRDDDTRGLSYLNPRVTSEWKAASMMGVMAAGAPEAYRRETAWCYAQGAPPVFAGDLNYYALEHDLRGKLDQIDTTQCAVYIVAGEYDPSAFAPDSDAGSKAVADGIDGAHYVLSEQGGHFLMSENPVQFLETIVPILREIAAG